MEAVVDPGQAMLDELACGTVEHGRADVFVGHLLTRGGKHGDTTKVGTVVIGVTVPVTTLAGVDDTPGESFDGQFALPADLVRDLAAEPGTLFHRIITDPWATSWMSPRPGDSPPPS